MKCCFLFVFCLSAGFLSTALESEEETGSNLKLRARLQGKLVARTGPEPGSPRTPKSLGNGHLWGPEWRFENSPRHRSSTPIPNRSDISQLERPRSPRPQSPSPRRRLPLPRKSSSKSLRLPGHTVSTTFDDSFSPWSNSENSGRKSRDLPISSSRTPSTSPRPPLRMPVEAHALVSGTGSVWSSSPRRHGGLTSQASITVKYKPIMKSAVDRDQVKAGSITRGRTSKATASATGPQVTGKLNRDANGSEIGSGSIEFRAGKSFTQIHKVALGEKIERTLTASDILDGKNQPFREITVSTHLRGAGSCSVSACHEDSIGSPPRSSDGEHLSPSPHKVSWENI